MWAASRELLHEGGSRLFFMLTCTQYLMLILVCYVAFKGPLKAALASKPAIVVLMLGTNDAKFHNWGPLHDEFPVDYKSMIDEFKNVSTKPTIYLMVRRRGIHDTYNNFTTLNALEY